MTLQLRSFARRFLPAPIRKPLGSLHGKFMEHVGNPALGLMFDLSGGRFKANGCVYVIPRDATRLGFRACFHSDVYEIDERQLVGKFVQPEDSVLELGACLGVVACITNKILREPLRHVVVEANPYCLPALHRNRNLNNCAFLIEHCAVSNQRELTFYLHPKYIVGSTTRLQTGLPVRVPGKSLPELCDRYGSFSVLIMDIEGSELEALRSAGDILRQFRLIIIELHEWVIGIEGVAECGGILEGAGFKMVERRHITEAWARL
jgi:FkbM family methyltransferase